MNTNDITPDTIRAILRDSDHPADLRDAHVAIDRLASAAEAQAVEDCEKAGFGPTVCEEVGIAKNLAVWAEFGVDPS